MASNLQWRFHSCLENPCWAIWMSQILFFCVPASAVVFGTSGPNTRKIFWFRTQTRKMLSLAKIRTAEWYTPILTVTLQCSVGKFEKHDSMVVIKAFSSLAKDSLKYFCLLQIRWYFDFISMDKAHSVQNSVGFFLYICIQTLSYTNAQSLICTFVSHFCVNYALLLQLLHFTINSRSYANEGKWYA